MLEMGRRKQFKPTRATEANQQDKTCGLISPMSSFLSSSPMATMASMFWPNAMQPDFNNASSLPFRCLWCEGRFDSLMALTQHVRMDCRRRFGHTDAKEKKVEKASATPSTTTGNGTRSGRKLVRGQDVWLGKGQQEQTRQILKCMWCGQSFASLADLTTHMQQTEHYTKVISQEQIKHWKNNETSTTSTTTTTATTTTTTSSSTTSKSRKRKSLSVRKLLEIERQSNSNNNRSILNSLEQLVSHASTPSLPNTIATNNSTVSTMSLETQSRLRIIEQILHWHHNRRVLMLNESAINDTAIKSSNNGLINVNMDVKMNGNSQMSKDDKEESHGQVDDTRFAKYTRLAKELANL